MLGLNEITELCVISEKVGEQFGIGMSLKVEPVQIPPGGCSEKGVFGKRAYYPAGAVVLSI